ncbi:MAG: hypothetical protein OSJ45_13510 [Lachnospiraceae bacterium]|nr:hypothetical protein [Lachnospiraceae bacterium]
MAQNGKVATQMRYDEILYEKTKIIAENELRTTNAQIEYFMKLGVEAYEKEHGIILFSSEQ